MTHLRSFLGRAQTVLRSPLGLALLIGSVAALLVSPAWGLAAGSLPVIFAATPQTDSDVVRQLAAWGILDACGGALCRVVVKTADYTIVSPVTSAGDASGTIFTNRGATGTVIFTLPAPVGALAGVYYEFVGIADFTMTVKTATADTLIAANDIAADSLSQATAGQLIAASMRAVCDGVSWIAMGTTPGKGADTTTTTFTVAT